MKLDAVDKLKIPERYKEPFAALLQLEILFMQLHGAVPRDLESVFEQAFRTIGSGGDCSKLKETIGQLHNRFLAHVEGRSE